MTKETPSTLQSEIYDKNNSTHPSQSETLDELAQLTQADERPTSSDTDNQETVNEDSENNEYRKKLRSHTQRLRQKDSDEEMLVANITELFLQNEFDEYVKQILKELRVDVHSFYR